MKLNEIVNKEFLASNIFCMAFYNPNITKSHKPGQFIILRPQKDSERIPLTVAKKDLEKGIITIYVQIVGKTTKVLSEKKKGDIIWDVVGPLGKPTHIENFGNVICVGGGIGVAPLYPITKALKEKGNNITFILGARSKELIIMEKEIKEVADRVLICTDDGSYGIKGIVTDLLEKEIQQTKIDIVFAIGPVVMMKAVSSLTKKYSIKTIVSLNPIMIDGTGMCGGCRVKVGGKTKFVCVDGPEFDGHEVDFDILISRLKTYREQEKISLEIYQEKCRCKE